MVCTIVDLLLPVWLLLLFSFPFVFNNISLLPKKKKIHKCYCRVTVCNPNSEELGYKPNKPDTINL